MRDIFDDDNDNGSGSSEFAELFEKSLNGSDQNNIGKSLKVGDKVKGEILSIGKEDIFVSTGTINDGVVMKIELLDKEGALTHKVGDVLDLYVTQVRGSQIFLSPKPTAKNMAEDLEDAFDMMLPVEGRVTETCNGGFRVSLMGKTAFCPISQMDLKRIDQPEEYVGRRFEFMITQFSERGRNIIVSRRKILEEQKELMQGSFVEDHRVGEFLPGKVTRIEKFGAFVEVAPGIEGLVHISEISWSRISDPSEVLRVGQDVSVKVLKIEEESGRMKISLSIKQGEPEPWALVPKKFAVGSVVKGRVERRESYGLFIRLDEGITGLLPKSKAYENPGFPFEKLKVGDEVVVQVAEVREAERRISLAPPQDPDQDAWRDFTSEPSQALGTLGDQFKALFELKQDTKKKG